MSESDRLTRPRPYPFGPPHRLDLHPRYAQLRRDEPVIRVRLPFGEPAWLATRYADVRTVLSDPRFGRAPGRRRDEPRSTPRQVVGGIPALDPPDHTRLRRLVGEAFPPRQIEPLRARIREVVQELLDDLLAAGPPADLVARLAVPLPIRVAGALLGVPRADRVRFHDWSRAVLPVNSLSPQQNREYLDNLHSYLGALIALRRRTPTDDLLGALVRAHDAAHPPVSEPELVRIVAGLLTAGHETTATQLPNFVYVLLGHPGELARLRRDPALIPTAVEELTRYVPLGTGTMLARYATTDVELGGVLLRAGEPVLGAIGSANRDETVFSDPDRLDVARHPNPHLGFGHGAHHCLGARLARAELGIALGALLERMPGLRLAVPETELEWRTGMLVRGLKRLPVAW